MANITLKRYDGTDWEPMYPKTTINQVTNLSSVLADLQSQINQLQGWTLLYSGSAALSSSSVSEINLSDSVNNGDVLAIEVRYGDTSTSYNSKIILTAIGSNNSTSTSTAYPRKIGFTDFDGEYFKNFYFIAYRYSATQIRAGYYSYLRGRFSPSTNTIEWNTNYTLSAYITRVWKVV